MRYLFSTDEFLSLLGIDPHTAFWMVVAAFCFIGIVLLIGAVIREGTGGFDEQLLSDEEHY